MNRRNRHARVPVVRRRAQDRVDVLLFVQQLAEIDVVLALELRIVLRVPLLDLRLDRQPARDAPVVPLTVVRLVPRIGDGDDLGVLLAEQTVGVGPPLPAAADDGDIDLLARRDELRPAQHISRHDRERRRGPRRPADELPSRDFRIRSVHIRPRAQQSQPIA